MKAFVGYKKEPLSVTELLDLIKELTTETSYYFLRWTHKVSGIIEKSPTNDQFPMLEGQMFNHECELRWKYKQKNTYEVLLLSVAGEYPEFERLGEDWQTQKRNAHLYSPTETRFPKGFSPTNLDIAQRYFIDTKTATVHFVALTIGKSS
ncbi:hypothetical protein BLD44_007405 [Mastigocladus laminosus UU774]|nr:hypothetical protein BLD44_007405 [Mastigocladus laminosus UU774]